MNTFVLVLNVVVLLYIVVSVGLFFFCFVRRKTDKIADIYSKQNAFLGKHLEKVAAGVSYNINRAHIRVYTKSYDNLKLSAKYYAVKDSHRLIILFHGYRSTANRDFSCAVKIYNDMGINVLLVDQRSHGKSDGKLITFGVKERCDVLTWIDYAADKFSENTEVFLGGMSMGATTVLLSAGLGLPDTVAGIIADCGFTSPVAIIRKVAETSFSRLSVVFIPFLELLCRVFGKFSLYECSTVDAVRDCGIPILFVHGKSDNFVPYSMSNEGYEAATGKKCIYLVEGATHGMSFLEDEKGVMEKVTEFLKACHTR